MEKDIRILVVDDHQVVREGLGRLLEQEKDMDLVGQGADSEEALFQVEILSPNIVLMDIKMPGMDGIELTRQVKQKCPSCNVIMLTLYDEYLAEAMGAGASGYLLKDIKRADLARAIRQVHSGEIVISDSITTKSRIEYDVGSHEAVEECPDSMFQEVQLVIPPPVEANQLMRFANQVEEILQSRVLQVIGSWQEGTAITITLTKATPLAYILDKMQEVSEVEAIHETPLTEKTSPSLLEKAKAVPKLENRHRKTIFVTLKNALVTAG